MKIIYPHTIENGLGEKIIFHSIYNDPDGDKLIVENFVTPGQGPPMHTHFLQDEELTVKSGKLGYEVKGGEKKYLGPGESILFKRGVPHRFWNAGEEILNCKGWVKPANTLVYFLSSIYAAQKKSGKGQPEKYDASYLMTRYSKEYDMPEIPGFVKKIIFPITVFMGKLMGKYKHFKDAPQQVKA